MANEVFTLLRSILVFFADPARVSTSSKAVAAAGDYAALDVLSESASAGIGSAWYVGELARARGKSFWLVGVRARCTEDSVAFRLRLHGFRRRPNAATEMDDNAGFTVNDADRFDNYLGPICDLPAFSDRGDFSESKNMDIRELITPASDADGLWFIVQTLDAETAETAGMHMVFEFQSLPL